MEILRQREAFIKKDKFKGQFRNHLKNEALLTRLANVGSVPELLAYYEKDGESGVAMEMINGFTLRQIPSELEDFHFSVAFAQGLAQLFTDLQRENAFHLDVHPENIMYGTERRRFVFVDLEELSPDRMPNKSYVLEFALALTGSYFGVDPFIHSEEIDEYTMSEERRKALRNLKGKYGDFDCLWKLLMNPKIALDFAGFLGLKDRIKPEVLEYICKAMQPTGYSSFKKLFEIPVESEEVQEGWFKNSI